MINFDTDKLVIVCYAAYAGGKFLDNSLGLSDYAVLQDAGLARQQLDGNLTPEDKFNLLSQRMQKPMRSWNDLNLGCTQLFGTTSDIYDTMPADAIKTSNIFNPVIDDLSNSSKYFFLNVQSTNMYFKFKSVWKNARTILFTNTYGFCQWREHKDYWDDFAGDISRIAPELVWDTNWYFSENDTVENIKKIYTHLNIPDFDDQAVRSYYQTWFDKLNGLKQQR